MRRPLDAERLRQVLDALGRACRGPGVLYLTGGATALLEGWRDSTVDIGLKLDPEPEGVFAAIARIKLRAALEEMAPRLERFPRVDRRVLVLHLEELCGSYGSGR